MFSHVLFTVDVCRNLSPLEMGSTHMTYCPTSFLGASTSLDSRFDQLSIGCFHALSTSFDLFDNLQWQSVLIGLLNIMKTRCGYLFS